MRYLGIILDCKLDWYPHTHTHTHTISQKQVTAHSIRKPATEADGESNCYNGLFAQTCDRTDENPRNVGRSVIDTQ